MPVLRHNMPSNSTSNEGPSPIQKSAGFALPARWKWLLRLLIGIAIICFLVSQSKGAAVRLVLHSISWPIMVGAVICYWLLQTISALKWQLLLRTQGARASLLDCCRLYLIGMFSNLWMPTNIGGDAIRIYLAAPLAGSKAVAASSVLVERLTGFIALLTIGAVGLGLRQSGYGSSHSNAGASAAHLITTMAGVLLLFGVGVFVMRQAAYRLEATAPENAMVRKWASLHRALDYYARPEYRATLGIALALSFLFQSLFVVLNIGLAHAVGLQLPASTFFWLVPLLSIASLLPLGVGGLGVREAAAVALLSGTSAATGTIVAWSLLWQATVWLASLPGALLGLGLKSNVVAKDES